MLKEKKLSTTFSKSILQKCEGEVKKFSNENQLKEYVISKSAYQKSLKEIPKTEKILYQEKAWNF